MSNIKFTMKDLDGTVVPYTSFVISTSASANAASFTTNLNGEATVSLAAVSTPYYISKQDGTTESVIAYKFFVPDTTNTLDAELLFVDMGKISKDKNDKSIAALIEAKVVAVNAANRALQVASLLGNVSTIRDNLDSLVQVANSVENVVTVANNIESIVSASDGIASISSILPYTANIATVANRIGPLVAVGNNINNINDVRAMESDIAAIADNIVSITDAAAAVTQAVDAQKDLYIAGTHYTKGVSATLNLSYTPAKTNAVKVFFEGVYQNKDTFTRVGKAITFNEAINVDNVEIHYEVPSQFVGLDDDDNSVLVAAQNAAQASANAAAASFDSFDDRYIGAKAVAPTLDNDGNNLLVGAKYFNSTENKMYVRNSSNAWQLDTADSSTVSYLPAGTGAVPTTVQSKLRETVSAKDFGAVGDGVTDDAAAIQAALTANPTVRLVFPPGTYKLDTPTGGNGTQVVEIMEGAVFTGAGGVYGVTKFSCPDGVVLHERAGVRGPYETVGHVGEYQNRSANGGMGLRTNYLQSETLTSGFSIGHGIVSSFPTVAGGQGLASWLVAASPTTDTTMFGIFGQEVNPINRTSDSGYAKKRENLARWSGGIQIVPEGIDLVSPGSLAIGNNVTYAFAVAKSGARGAGGSYARSHNGLLIEASAITAGGRGALISGDDLGEALPAIGVEIDQSWGTGISTRSATFTGNEAIHLGNNHKIVFGNPAGSTFVPSVSGASDLMSVGYSDGEVARFIRGATNSVNYLVLRGNATSKNPALEVAGSDAVIGLTLGSKGVGSSIIFSPNGFTSFRVDAVANQVNYGQAFGGAANSPVTFAAVGVDTNIDIALQPKGTGVVLLGAWTTNANAAVNGYITVKDAGGNIRKLATIG